MRYREPFTLFPRTLKSGKTVYYYRTYDRDGHRTTARSTGQSTKTTARAYCTQLLREDRLVPARELLFRDYAIDWWIYEKCRYIKGRLARRGAFSRTHADIQRMNLEKHILPAFGDTELNKITSGQIESWLLSFQERGLSNVTANHCLATLRIMLNEAYRLELIKHNPVAAVKPLKEQSKARSILTLQEVKTLFESERSRETWSSAVTFAANLLGACTGMRLGEVQALQVEDVYPDHVHVCRSLDRRYGLKDTKNGESRDIPIPSSVSQCLQQLKEINPRGFIFSNNGGNNPVYHKTLTGALYRALCKIGISAEERKARNITFHSWRHFFNSLLRSRVPDSKLKKLTGHRTQGMTERYTHFGLQDFEDVKEIQEQLV